MTKRQILWNQVALFEQLKSLICFVGNATQFVILPQIPLIGQGVFISSIKCFLTMALLK